MDEKILNSTMKNIQITHDDECKPLYEEKTNNPLQQAKQKYLASFINAEKSNFLIFNSEHLLSEESFKSTRNKRIVFAHHLHDNEYIIDGCIIFYKDASLDNRYFKGYPILFASLANFKAEHISVYQQIIFQKMLKKIHSLFDNKQFLYTNLLKNYEKKYHCFLRKMGGSMVFFPSLDQYYPNEKNHFVIGFENSSNSKIEKTIVQEFSVKTKNSYFEYNLEDEIKGNIECKIFDKTAFLENESDRDYYVQQILDIVCAENKKILDSSNEHSTEKKIVDFYYSNNMFFNLVLDKNYEYFDSIYSDTWIFALSKGIDEKTKVIGFLLCNKRNHELNQNENMQIDIAAVRPNMQNKGVFKAMLTCLFTHLKRTNPSEKKIQLNVKRDNVNAITAYTKTGGKEQKTQHETDNLVVFDVQKCLSKWNNTKI